MKRDPRLRGLSSEHHLALVLARDLPQQPWTTDRGEALKQRFDRELDPHFRTEEELLLPALRSAGADGLADRAQRDHDFLRRTVARASAGDPEAVVAFAERLRDHVRFEEREMFGACEALLDDDVLDEVARRVPHD